MSSASGRPPRSGRSRSGSRRLCVALAAGTVALLSFAGSASAASFAANPGSLGAIPDGTVGCPGSYGADLDVTFTVAGVASSIQNVAVSLTLNPPHTWAGDLSAALIAPGGAPSQAVFHRTGAPFTSSFGNNSNVAGPYTFSDTAPPSPTWWEAAAAADTNTAIPSGSYRPSTPGEDLSGGANTLFGPVFSAATPNGTWILRFRDKCTNETGSVSAATLFLNEGLPAPPTSTGPTGQRAAALKKCKKKPKGPKRKKCIKKAKKLPV